MMKFIESPGKNDWAELVQRPIKNAEGLGKIVDEIFAAVKSVGDDALLKYARQFDGLEGDVVKVDKAQIKLAEKKLPSPLVKAIRLAYENIYAFHKAQINSYKRVNHTKGVSCWIETRPINTVGLYIPGGTVPLFSTVLMLGIPAKIAGCKNVIITTPSSSPDNIHPAILFAAGLCGIENIFCIGGIQAIAGLCLGTGLVPKADKIYGPGNQYVTAAKMKAGEFGVAIDMPAGPSEVLVIADKYCVPAFAAADLLSQAEHGADSQVILLGNDKKILEKILAEVETQLEDLPRKEIAQAALQNSKAIWMETLDDCIEFSNAYAPEHLILAVKNPLRLSQQVSNAGSVFLGNYSCESAGDYASGTNHCLPTNGFAKSYSGLGVAAFQKTISFQEISKNGLQRIGPAIELMAEAEQLVAHKNSVSIRLGKGKRKK